jgi:dihydroflavonol-4-reductase
MKVLVFGAAGYVGAHVVSQLLERGGCEVAVGVRDASRLEDASRLTVLQGDLHDAEYVRRAVDGADAVIFSAGMNWAPGAPNDEFWRRNVEITENLFSACRRRTNMRVVFTSSTATIGGSDRPHVFTEQSGRSFVREDLFNPYALAKLECDRLADVFGREGGNVVILHPGFMLGPGAGRHSKLSTCFLVEDFCLRKYPFYPDGGHSYCDVRDVAAAHLAGLQCGKPGEHYLVAGHNLALSEMYAWLAGLTGMKPPRKIPLSLAYWATRMNDAAAAATRGLIRSPMRHEFVKSFGLYFFADSQKARDELGYSTRQLDETLIDTLRHLRKRELLPERWEFVHSLTPDNVASVVCLKQLASRHVFSKSLLPRFPAIFNVCQGNHDLRAALARIVEASRFEAGQLRVPRSCKRERWVIDRMFDYVYFGSDEFLQEVIPG